MVVAGLVLAVALTMGQGEAKPKDALALIFGIIGVFVLVLFLLQARDLSAAEAAEAGAGAPAAAEIENPATMDEPSLWAALAIRPIDAAAVRARKAIWSSTRGSMRMAWLVTTLIFLSVPPIYLLDTFVPVLIGAPLIAGIALWKSARLLASGGDLDQVYDEADRAVAPLGLSVAERPEVRIEAKSAAPFRMGPGIHGALVLEGKRHGRPVVVRMPADEGVRSKCEVRLGLASEPFEFRTRDGRLKAKDGAPPSVAAALKSVPNSTRWKGVSGGGGPEGLVVKRTGVASGDWLLDLWLAERLADAMQPSPSGAATTTA